MKRFIINWIIPFILIVLILGISLSVLDYVAHSPEFLANTCCNGSVCSDVYLENLTCIITTCMNNVFIINKSVCMYEASGLEALSVL
jgi:hypothetical protein